MRTRVARLLSLGSYLGLIALCMLWAIRLGELPRDQISITLLLLVLPLLIPLRGILHARHKPLVWGMLVALIPLLHGGVVLWAEAWPKAAWGGLELLLAIGYITLGSFFIRWRAQAER
jgi:uncharacterized membrane protein